MSRYMLNSTRIFELPGGLTMEDFREHIRRIVQAPSVVQKKKEISRMSVAFYGLCREEGLEQEDIINLTTQILDCFLTDLNYLRIKLEKVEKKKKKVMD